MVKLPSLGAAALLLLACSGSSIGTSPGTDGGTTDAGHPVDAAGTAEGGDTGTTSEAGVGPCNASTINLTFGTCPAAPTCGGTIADGTYYYTTGCLPDPWAQTKAACPAAQVSNEQGTVKGCVTFAGGTVDRNVTSTYGATLDLPTSCLFGGTCAQLETLLKQYIQTASCTASASGCTCSASQSYMATAGGSYTTSSNQITTSLGNHYDYCVNGGTLGVQWLSGPNAEPGNYTLTKQ